MEIRTVPTAAYQAAPRPKLLQSSCSSSSPGAAESGQHDLRVSVVIEIGEVAYLVNQSQSVGRSFLFALWSRRFDLPVVSTHPWILLRLLIFGPWPALSLLARQ